MLELVAAMAAFLGPAVVLHVATTGSRRALLLPLASLAASLLVLALGATARALTFGALRRATAPHLAEGVGVGLAGAVLALFRLREVIGWPMAFFVIAFCPAVFEELAFRGLLHARLVALAGIRQGILITGATFALAHGITLGLPFHMGLGVYLSWLRHRSDSLVPGMLVHFVYNGTLLAVMAQTPAT